MPIRRSTGRARELKYNVPESLKTESATNPLGITDTTPDFGWTTGGQDNYQLQVNANADFSGTVLWDTGKTASESATAVYAGDTLTAGATYYWRVKIWWGAGLSDYSTESAFFRISPTARTGQWLGDYEFNGLQLISSSDDRSIVIFPKPGHRYTTDDLGISSEVMNIEGILYDSDFETDLTTLRGIYNIGDILSMNADFLDTSIFVRILSMTANEVAGQPTKYNFNFSLQHLGPTDEYSRVIIWQNTLVTNDFSITDTGDNIFIDMPTDATLSSEGIDDNRGTPDGDVPTIQNPTLFLDLGDNKKEGEITFESWSTEKSNIEISMDPSHLQETIFDNGLFKLQTRHNEGDKFGSIDVSYYDGSADVDIGQLRFKPKSSGGTLETLEDSKPIVEILYTNKRYMKARLLYPKTTTNSYEVNIYLEMWRGKPFVKITAENRSSTALVEIRYAFYDTKSRDNRYYYEDSTDNAVDAQSGVLGDRTQARDALTENFFYLKSASTIADSTELIGFAVAKKADCDQLANDAGSVWDNLRCKFDSVSIAQAASFDPCWFFAYQKDNIEIDPDTLGNECMQDIRTVEDIKPLIE